MNLFVAKFPVLVQNRKLYLAVVFQVCEIEIEKVNKQLAHDIM